jgi:hypothetical protein
MPQGPKAGPEAPRRRVPLLPLAFVLGLGAALGIMKRGRFRG